MGLTSSSSAATIFLLLGLLPVCRPQSDSFYYDTCAPMPCGNVTITFPFFSSESFCGLPGYEVTCIRNGTAATPRFTQPGRSYTIRNIYQPDALVKVSDTDLVNSLQSGECDSVKDHSLPISWGQGITFWSSDSSGNKLSFFSCPFGTLPPPPLAQVVLNYTACKGNTSLYYYPSIFTDYQAALNATLNATLRSPAAPCTHVPLPVLTANTLNIPPESIVTMLNGGFTLQWPNQTKCYDCQAAGGRCGYNQTTNAPLCFCKGVCAAAGGGGNSDERNSLSSKVIAAIVVPSGFIVVIITTTILKFRSKAMLIIKNLRVKKFRHPGGTDVQDFVKNYKSMLPTQYSYVEIKKMSGGFKEKLGQGGGGNVFKGRLPNGTLMATKLLEKSRDDGGRDFVNEVATIGRIHHFNIIRLLGFCCDHWHRALVYDFMPNGSLGDLLSDDEARRRLGTGKLLEIAIETGRGIEYLHQGCDIRILHLDIKPQNILLDENFHPKISDFGLAKSHSRKRSAVELTGARGTIGYIAPEVFLRNLGGVSHKSDVYSYGMVILDMVLAKRDTIIGLEGRTTSSSSSSSSSSSKAYFPHWIYEKLDQWRETEVAGAIVDEERTMARKMVMVGLWCIQTRPADRPSISRVLEMLAGRVEDIQLPPRPILCSPPREMASEQESTPMNSKRGSMPSTSTGSE